MVGYDPSAAQLSSWQHAQAGAVSGLLTRLCCQPLDVLKIRFQVSFLLLSLLPGTPQTSDTPIRSGSLLFGAVSCSACQFFAPVRT